MIQRMKPPPRPGAWPVLSLTTFRPSAILPTVAPTKEIISHSYSSVMRPKIRMAPNMAAMTLPAASAWSFMQVSYADDSGSC
jgi:hypothetical protein